MGYVDVGGAALCLKMVFSCKNCLLVTYVIPLLALAVASFAGTLILGKKQCYKQSLINIVFCSHHWHRESL